MMVPGDETPATERSGGADTPPLPTEIIIHIMTYLSVSDRASAAQVNHQWREAALDTQFIDQQILILSRQRFGDNLYKALSTLRHSARPFLHFKFKEVELRRLTPFWNQFGPNMRSLILVNCDLGERALVDILKCCESLRVLHINACRECLMSGRLLDEENDVETLAKKLHNVTELSLAYNRYLSDALFNRLVAVCPNLVSLSLMGCQISFHSGLYRKFYPNNGSVTQASESVLTFYNVLHYLMRQAKRLKHLSFGYTLIDGTALATLSAVDDLHLESLKLHACEQLTNVGIRALTEHQTSLKVLDVSYCTRVTDTSLLCICKNLINLEVFNIRRCRAVTDQGIKQIRNLRKLKELDISECEQLTSECITSSLCAVKAEDCAELSENEEENAENENPNEQAEGSKEFVQAPVNENLEKLSANALNLDQKSIVCIAISYPKLKLLDVGNCFSAVTDKTIQVLFKELVLLRFLRVGRCDKVSDVGLTGMGAGNRENVEEGWIKDIPEFPEPNLRISLGSRAEEEIVQDAKRKREVMKLCEDLSSPVENEICSGFSLARLKGLRYLDLSGCNRISDVSLKYAFHFVELKDLDLSMCQQVTYVGLDYLTRNNPAIEELNLSQCHNVTDVGILYVAQRLRRLKVLRLQGCSQLTDRSLDSIKIHCIALRYLDARGCRGMTTSSLESLIHLHVEYTKQSEDIMHQTKAPPPAPHMRR